MPSFADFFRQCRMLPAYNLTDFEIPPFSPVAVQDVGYENELWEDHPANPQYKHAPDDRIVFMIHWQAAFMFRKEVEDEYGGETEVGPYVSLNPSRFAFTGPTTIQGKGTGVITFDRPAIARCNLEGSGQLTSVFDPTNPQWCLSKRSLSNPLEDGIEKGEDILICYFESLGSLGKSSDGKDLCMVMEIPYYV